MTDVTVQTVVDALEAAYPPALAESWDQVGLICGDPDAEVGKVAFALDCTQDVAERAVATGAQMLVVHHPLLLRGVHSVAANTPKGKVIHTLLRGGVALFAAHTNADSARPGVSDLLAELGPDATPREIDARWRRWYEANRRVIGDDPHLLLPGTVLTSPVFAPHAGVDGPRP